jgi:hypothetical protein
MPASQASIPIMGLRIGKRFKEKTKGFIFSFKTFFPIILSNQILQYKSQCARESGAKGRDNFGQEQTKSTVITDHQGSYQRA